MPADSGILIETARLELGAITVDDAEIMLAIWNDPTFIQNVSDRGVRTLDEAKVAVAEGAARMFDEYGYGPYWLALKSDGSRIGICGLFKRDNLAHPDIGFALLPDWVGKGYAKEAAFAVRDYARDVLKLPALTAIVSPDNAASVGLIRKLGMSFERMVTMPGDDDAIALYSMTFGHKD